MTGIIKISNRKYIFRDDHGYEKSIWAWDIKGDYDRGMVHKWKNIPKGEVELFDIDNPPKTITFQPLLK